MVTKTFGDMLYCPKSDYLLEFPSPGSLKKRVLISTKPPEYRDSRHARNNKQKQDLKDHSEDEENSGNKAHDNKVHVLLNLIANKLNFINASD